MLNRLGPEQQQAFVCLKAEVMKYFNPSVRAELIVDASLVGLGPTRTLVTAHGGQNLITYASHSLTDCESRYSQTERGALALVWGIEHIIYKPRADNPAADYMSRHPDPK